MNKHGHIQIHVSELIAKAGISKNTLCQRAELQRPSLNQYCNNTITRLDTEVLARMCTALHCGIGDLLEFVPDAPQEK